MAAHLTTRPAPLGAITTYRVVTFLASLSGHLAAWNDARMTRKSLEKLSDHELSDIGLCRGDIDDIARVRF